MLVLKISTPNSLTYFELSFLSLIVADVPFPRLFMLSLLSTFSSTFTPTITARTSAVPILLHLVLLFNVLHPLSFPVPLQICRRIVAEKQYARIVLTVAMTS
jgi:hypothetical protein